MLLASNNRGDNEKTDNLPVKLGSDDVLEIEKNQKRERIVMLTAKVGTHR